MNVYSITFTKGDIELELWFGRERVHKLTEFSARQMEILEVFHWVFEMPSIEKIVFPEILDNFYKEKK